MRRPLAEGVYDHLVTEELASDLDRLDPAVSRDLAALSAIDGHVHLARHVGREVERILASLPAEQRELAAADLVAGLLDRLAELADARALDGDPIRAQRLAPPPRQLRAVYRAVPPPRTTAPIAQSTLFTRGHGDPAIGHELAREIASADRIEAIVAFVTVGGVSQLRDALEGFCRRGTGVRFRLLTTTFTGTTEPRALDQLAALPGVEVKVSYDTRRTRLHAKAWRFHRDSGLSTAYVGSANLTSTALAEGHEWMLKVSAVDLPDVLGKFTGTFETLWLDPEFETYDPSRPAARDRLVAALGRERGDGARLTMLVALRPYPFQEEILDRLTVARTLHGRTRNLVVAATGTGKTVIAALDYARLADAEGTRPRLLFLAHRQEILERSRDTFRHALSDAAFGELMVGKHQPSRFEHVFASIQGAARLIERVGPSHFRHVVVDECHHVPAESYQAVIPTLAPDQLVGLTATPERQDGRSLLPDFGGHVAAELRLWHALDRQLLVPFNYFGISDGVDLRRVRWSRAGYDLGALADLYTGHDARADLVLTAIDRRVADLRRIRALGFCVSVEHAEFMAAHFSARGVPALAVHGGTAEDERADAPRRLRERDVNVLFTCDLYNEGVDLPFVDTLLLLRPTMSATLFTQQLGRGLRLDAGKTSCLVLDFIGQHHTSFRFDGVLAALTGLPRARLRAAIEDGFPFLPSGCGVTLDRVARDAILTSLRAGVASATRLAEELRELTIDGQQPRLAQFLGDTGRDLDDIYDGDRGWHTIRHLAAGRGDTDDAAADLSRRLGRLRHLDEPTRLRQLASLARDAPPAALTAADRRRWTMLDFQLNHRGVLREVEAVIADLRGQPTACAELDELLEVLDERVPLAVDSYPVPEWPLALHRHYSRREIVAAVGFVAPGARGKLPQSGILKLEAQRRELLFVTLDKSGRDFSPTTRYRDFAVSADRFHWETQAAATVTRASGQRYVDPASGIEFHLFVRGTPDEAYAYLGPVRYLDHRGDRPIAVTWQLTHPMPAALYDRYATLASG